MPAFTNTVGPELDAGLRRARAAGAKRLVLDLRGSVGGPLERALQVASRFTEGSMGSVERKVNGRLVRSDLKVSRSGEWWDGPVAVLVDGTTLGTAELLASGLDAHRRAPLVGSRTFGDGTEQNVLLLKDGSAMLLTTGKYFQANGATWNTRGVAPKTVVANADGQLKAALRAVKGAG
jgi:carboxyl-terminal processing protease